MKIRETFKESCFKTSHSMLLHGETIEFDAIAEDFVFEGETGEPEASIFSTSYLRKGVNTDGRPVVFVFGGGPGAGCIMEQVSFFGPWRMKLDEQGEFAPAAKPYQLEDNPHSPLDICDIVIVDSIGAGYGRLLDESKMAKYCNLVADIKCLADFVESWLNHYARWNSPIYLSGTSYGTLRCARLVEELAGGAFHKNGRQRSIDVAGIILTGSIVAVDNLDEVSYDDNSTSATVGGILDPGVALIPSMALANWYHHPESRKADEQETWDSAWDWAVKVLAPFKARLQDVSAEEKAKIAGEMSAIVGIPAETLLGLDLNIGDAYQFAPMLLADQGRDIGIYDSRMTLQQSACIGVPDPAGDDPGMGVYTGPYVVLANGELKQRLGIDFDRQYYDVNFSMIYNWDYKLPEMAMPDLPARTHTQCLIAAMRRNEKMKVVFSTGYYDLCTTGAITNYVARNLGFPRDRTIVMGVHGGHYAYTTEQGAADYEVLFRKLLG